MSTLAQSIVESLSAVSEEYPKRLKAVLNAKELKEMGDTLSKLGFDVQRTDFGAPVVGLSNRDPRVKDPSYLVVIIRAGAQDASHWNRRNAYVLHKGKVIFGDEQAFKESSWTTILAGAEVYLVSKTDTVSTKDLRAQREQLKSGALAVDVAKARKKYNDQLASYMKDLTSNSSYSREWAERGLADLERDYDPTGNYRNNIDKYRRKLQDLRKQSNAAMFDELNEQGVLLDQIQEYLVTCSTAMINHFRATFKDKTQFANAWSNNRESGRTIDHLSRLQNRMSNYLESFLSEGGLSDSNKEEVLKMLKEGVK